MDKNEIAKLIKDNVGEALKDISINFKTLPNGVESVDLKVLCEIEAGTENFEIFSLTAKDNEHFVFTHYAIFTDNEDADLIEFKPSIQKSRILKYHGNPNEKFKLALGLAPDLANSALIECRESLSPGQTLRWLVDNLNATVSTPMGVRMVGYLDKTKK